MTEQAAGWTPGTPWMPEPGIYPDVPAVQYHSCPYASNSRLGLLVPPSTPAHLKARLDEPEKDKKVFKEGRILHACVLEHERYVTEYRVAGECVGTTQKGLPCKAPATIPVLGGGEACHNHADGFGIDDEVLLVSPGDDRMARGCRESFLAHEIARGFLSTKDAEIELTVIFREPITGVLCKIRVDWYSPTMMGGLPMDLKGAREASTYEFTKQAVYNGYLRQSVLYRMGLQAVGLPAATFASVAIEKVPPFELMVYLLGDDATGALPTPGEEPQHMARLIIGLLRLWDQCQTTGIWPGYDRHIHTMTTPDWAWSDIDRQTAKLDELVAMEAVA